ncbi:hypothetical protein [Flavobacterium geliluteum]|uniref:Lipoprotein n=1 Tax=Flavobacterium geliluteum TaxID=2816120 RepID=A0A941AVV1_9FLAO|nr:hypothetical protein [Flavobacterium geliluteum]MBP4136510.1 hypothetical protein [Flavobacterium geliluteum]
MKKVLLAILLLVVTSVAYISCTKEQSEEQQSITGRDVIPLADYGFYHNEALALYYKNQNGVNQKTTNIIIDEMTADLTAKYPEKFKNVDVSDIKEAFKDIDPRNFDIALFWNSKKEELYRSNKLSRKLGSFVDAILKKDMEYDQYVVEIENFKKSNSLNLEEQNKLVVFESVLKSSNEYWSSTHNSTNKSNSKPGSKVIVADTLGALIFAYSGPGAIIAGGISSLFVNEALPPYEVAPLEPENPEILTPTIE